MIRLPIILIIASLFQFPVFNAFSQPVDIEPPLDIPLLLSGNFGELRSTHFHAGIDIKTQGVTGKPIFAAMKGYVSRFKVQAGGYGHAIYITHENGYTTVYGHLQEYYPELEAYLKETQYRKKSFEVDIYPEKNKFKVERGQQIGVSGNTGYSGGPHLHFEVRNANQVPQNVLRYNLPIKDTIAPKFRKLAVYDNIDSNTFTTPDKRIYSVSGVKGNYVVSQIIPIGANVSFGAEVYDFLNGSQNKCGVYKLQMLIDNKELYSFTIDEISFKETRYIKSHLDYHEKKLNKRNVHKLFRLPNNQLSIYDKIVNKGIVSISDTLQHQVKIVAVDAYGNTSNLSFKIYRKPDIESPIVDTGSVYVNYKTGVNYTNDVFNFSIAPGGLFSDIWLSYMVVPSENAYYSDIHIIGDELVAVNKYPELILKVTKPLNNLPPEKLVIASVSPKGTLKSEGGRLSNEGVKAKVSGFGRYVIAADTLSPEIRPYSFRNKAWYAANDRISFKISDDLSGVKTYNGYIDGEWALFEYDAKTSTLFYKIDASKLERSKGKHLLKIFVLDERNNMKKYEGEFLY